MCMHNARAVHTPLCTYKHSPGRLTLTDWPRITTLATREWQAVGDPANLSMPRLCKDVLHGSTIPVMYIVLCSLLVTSLRSSPEGKCCTGVPLLWPIIYVTHSLACVMSHEVLCCSAFPTRKVLALHVLCFCACYFYVSYRFLSVVVTILTIACHEHECSFAANLVVVPYGVEGV